MVVQLFQCIRRPVSRWNVKNLVVTSTYASTRSTMTLERRRSTASESTRMKAVLGRRGPSVPSTRLSTERRTPLRRSLRVLSLNCQTASLLPPWPHHPKRVMLLVTVQTRPKPLNERPAPRLANRPVSGLQFSADNK